MIVHFYLLNSKAAFNWIDNGAETGVDVNAGTYTQKTITFNSPCPSSLTPRIFCSLRSNSILMNRAKISFAIASQSSNSAVITVFNDSTSNLTGLVFNWFAIA